EDLLPAPEVGRVNHDLPVEPARTHQRRVENVRTVGRGHDDHALRRVESVHLDEELIEGLLALVVGTEPRAHDPGADLADRVDLIEEHEGGRLLLRLLEQLPNPGRAETDEHLDELGAAHEEERNVRLTGDRPCEQRLAAPRRTEQQHTLRDPTAEALILLRVLKELDDLLELLLRLVDASDVG